MFCEGFSQMFSGGTEKWKKLNKTFIETGNEWCYLRQILVQSQK